MKEKPPRPCSPAPPEELAAATPGYVDFAEDEIEQSIPARFAAIVARSGNRPAVVEASASTTYEQLDAASNRVARGLLDRLGEGSEPVAIFMRDGIDAVAAILGVLKAGKIFCPFEVSLPSQRLREILEHSGTRLVIVDGSVDLASEALPRGVSRASSVDLAAAAGVAPRLAIDPQAPAWLMYTSGSTGRPKGVIQSHRNQLVFTQYQTRHQRYNPEDRLGLLFPLSFALSTFPLFAALCNGGSLHLWDPRQGGLEGVAGWLARHGITMTCMLPSLFRETVAAAPEARAFASLRYLMLVLESVRREHVELFRRFLPDHCVLAIHFGSTEAYFITWLAVSKSAAIDSDPLPIGYPTEMTEITLIDEDGREVPDGATGEMVVASRAMVPGYWREPALTEATFRPARRGAPWVEYNSGDLARRRPDGALEFLGRKARRLKIDGQTVEPAEVERVLLSLPGIVQAHALGRPSSTGGERLVAYVAGGAGAPLSPATIRAAVAKVLPAAMVPSSVVVLDQLPFTSRGKIDLAALPAPDIETGGDPRDQVEEMLQRQFAAALGVETIGVETDFFAAGGSSLQALQLLAWVGRQAGRTLELPLLLAAPTVRAFAAVLRGEGAQAGELVTLRGRGTKAPFFGVWDGSGEVFSVHQVASHLEPDRPAWAVRSPLLTGYRRPVGTLEEMAAGAITHIRSARGEGPYVIAGYSFGGVLAFEIARQLVRAGATVSLLVIIDALLSWTVTPSTYEAGLAGLPRVVQEGRRHLAAVRAGGRQGAWEYLSSRLRQRWTLAKLAVMLPLWSPWIRRGRTAPPSLRAEHFVRLHGEVWKRYVPGTYGGRALLIVGGGEGKAEIEAWSALLTGEVSVEEIACTHQDVIHDPHVSEIGRIVERHLALAERRTHVVGGAAGTAK